MDLFRHYLSGQVTYNFPLTQPISLIVDFYFKHPIGTSKKNQFKKLHIKKPDLSNLIKFIEDAFIGILFEDDRTIAHIQAYKFYDHSDRIEIIVQPLTQVTL